MSQLTYIEQTFKTENSSVAANLVQVYGTNAGYCKTCSADNQLPIGVNANDSLLSSSFSGGGSQAGKNLAVVTSGVVDVLAVGAVAYGAKVIAASGGGVKTLPTSAGTYNVLGIAEKDGTDVVISVKINIHTVTVPEAQQ